MVQQFKPVKRKLADVDPAAYNPRRISDDELEGLRESLKTFGLVQQLIVNKRTKDRGWPKGSRPTLVGGHQRMRVLELEGEEDAYFVEVDLDETDEKALNVTLNNPEIQGRFDGESLAVVLKDIEEARGREYYERLRMDEVEVFIPNTEAEPPEEFQDFDDETIKTEHKCPKCQYEWSGSSS